MIVGGKNSAAEAALEIYRAGGHVTMVHRGPGFGESVKYWVKPDIENRVKEGSIAAHFNAQVAEIRSNEVVLDTRRHVAGGSVLLLTGYRADPEFMRSIGVEINAETHSPKYSVDTYETNVPGLFVAGGQLAGKRTGTVFIENGRFHGEVIAKTIAARKRRRSDSSPGAHRKQPGPSSRRVAHRGANHFRTTEISLTLREGTSMAAALSPDGRTLMIDLLGSLWTLPATGGDGAANHRRIHGCPSAGVGAGQSPRRVSGLRDGVWHIYVMNADGSGLRAMTSGPFDDREPSWSRDGSRIAFSSDRSGNYDIWDLEVASGAVRQMTSNPANDFAPAWSPVDSTIAFVSEREDRRGVWTVDAGDRRRNVAGAGRGRGECAVVEPDGSKVIYNVIAANRAS